MNRLIKMFNFLPSINGRMWKCKRIIHDYLIKFIKKTIGKGFEKCDFESVEIVSFDVFDTLIFRAVSSPADVFDMIYPVDESFKMKRINAAIRARQKCNREDCTLTEIYECMPEYANKKMEEIMFQEIEAELKVCYANKEAMTFFNICKKANKKVIVISDMYLSSDYIRLILTHCGYDLSGVNLYISGEYGATKRSGHLFEIVVNKEKTSEILHIGDNFYSDYIMAKKGGIKGVLYNGKVNK